MKKLSLLFLMMLLPSMASAAAVEINGIYYNLNLSTKEAEVTRNPNKYSGEILIPEIVKYNEISYSVKSIGSGAFYQCIGLISVKIPNSVTSIGDMVFDGCSGLVSLTIPNNVTSIGMQAFCHCCDLTTITIPNSVSFIGENAFLGCSGITSMIVEEGNSVYDSRENCNAIIRTADNKLLFGCKQTTIPNGITSIGFQAFADCSGLTSVSIPNSVTSIGNGAFLGCSGLASVSIPNSITSIGNRAFSGTAWYNNQPDGLVYVGKVAYEYKGTMPDNTEITFDEGTLCIAEGAFNNCSGLISVTIPNSVSFIGDNAFDGCSNLTSVIIPNSVTSIGNGVFSDCNSLSSVNIPNSVTSIGNYAFGSCSNLTSINIPNSVTSLGKRAFENCSSLISVTIPNSVTSIGDDVFYGTPWLFNQPDGVVYIGSVVYIYKGEMPENTEIEIKEGTTSIYDYAFSGCSGLTSITIPSSVNSIGFSAFDHCANLSSVIIPDNVAIIPENAFQHCYGLTSITIGSKVKTIEMNAFSFCYSMTSVSIPNSVTSIGNGAFSGCSGLTYVSIGNSVTEIEVGAFSSCSGLTSVTIPNSVTSIGRNAFYNCNNLVSLIIPSSVIKIGTTAFDCCTKLNTIIVPVTNVSEFCSNKIIGILCNIIGKPITLIDNEGNEIKDLIIPEDATSIGEYAFQNCSGLTSISIPNSVCLIGDAAFKGCSNLKSVSVQSEQPIAITEDVFSNRANASLYVPRNCVSNYKNADYWKDFGTIMEQGTVLTEKDRIFGDDVNVYIGYTADLQISMSNENSFTAYQFDIVLPNGITLAKNENNKYVVTKGNRYSDDTHQIKIEDLGNNTFRFMCVSLQNTTISGTDGVILTASIKAEAEIAAGVYGATIKNVILTMADETKMKPKDTSSSIETKVLLKGDANGDGDIDVADVVAAINYIMGNPSSNFNLLAADLNGDGEVDIFDVMKGISLAMKNKNTARGMTRATEGTDDLAYVTTTADGVTLGVNDTSRFTAFQFDVDMADGMELTYARLNASEGNHKLQFVNNGQNSYRVMGISMNNSTLTTNGNQLVELVFSKGGNVQISNIAFVTPQETKICFASRLAHATCIDSIQSVQAENIFDLSGRKVDTDRHRLQKGMYIINKKKVVIR